MNRLLAVAVTLVALAALAGADIADAKRMGGGRSMGSQRQMTPAPAPSPPPRASPSTPGASQALPRATPAPATAAAAKPSGMSRWLGPIAGLAAGLGLAALMSHLGLSEAFGSFLLLALLAVVGVVVVRMLLSRRNAPARPMQYAGAGASPARVEPQIGGQSRAFEPVMGGGTAPQPSAPASSPRYPPGFDPAPFVEQAKIQFRELQAAYDSGDRKALSEVMTPDMFADVSRDLAERASHLPTEVIRLDAEVLDVATEGRQHWMSVRFTGVLREDGTVLPKDFDEVWNLVKPVDGSSGWLLAGIQQSHEMA